MNNQRRAELFRAIQVEAWGMTLPTERLARLIAGDLAAIDEPCTPPSKSVYTKLQRRIASLEAQLKGES